MSKKLPFSDPIFSPHVSVTTFSNTSNSSPVFAVSTVGPELHLLNSMTGDVVRQTPSPSLITHLEFSHSLLLSGSSDGYVRTHDPRTGVSRAEGSVMAHYSGIQGLQTTGNFVLTIGLGVRCLPVFKTPNVVLIKINQTRTSFS